MKDIKDLRKLSLKDLQSEVSAVSKQLFKTQMAVRAQQEKQVHLVKSLKKNIARIETVIREKRDQDIQESIQQAA